MALDEAIKHCEEKAKELSDKAYQEWGKSMTEEEAYDCNECAREYGQLAEWLKDYKRLKETAQPIQVSMKGLTVEEKQHFFNVWKNASLQVIEERPQGEWVVDEFGRKICGKCQFPFAEFQSNNYCSLCGAKMEKTEKSE